MKTEWHNFFLGRKYECRHKINEKLSSTQLSLLVVFYAITIGSEWLPIASKTKDNLLQTVFIHLTVSNFYPSF